MHSADLQAEVDLIFAGEFVLVELLKLELDPLNHDFGAFAVCEQQQAPGCVLLVQQIQRIVGADAGLAELGDIIDRLRQLILGNQPADFTPILHFNDQQGKRNPVAGGNACEQAGILLKGDAVAQIGILIYCRQIRGSLFQPLILGLQLPRA
ncbi:hypothetical protein D3C73_732140 [compost metagenome]